MAKHSVRVVYPHVTIDPEVLGGSPFVTGSRVPVRRLWAWHKGGTTIETLLRRYPQLGPARVLSALAFAYEHQEMIEEDLSREQALLINRPDKGVGLRPLAQQPLPIDTGPAGPPTPRSPRRR